MHIYVGHDDGDTRGQTRKKKMSVSADLCVFPILCVYSHLKHRATRPSLSGKTSDHVRGRQLKVPPPNSLQPSPLRTLFPRKQTSVPHPLLGATCASVCVFAARGDFIPHYLILDNVSASVGAVLTTTLLFFSAGCDWHGHSEVPPRSVKNHPPPSFAKQTRGRCEGKLKRKEKNNHWNTEYSPNSTSPRECERL